jgi:hypothetical protein
MKKYSWLVGLENYEPFIGLETVERLTPATIPDFGTFPGDAT